MAHLQCIFIFKSIVMTEVTTLPEIYDFALESFGCQGVNCWNRVATILADERLVLSYLATIVFSLFFESTFSRFFLYFFLPIFFFLHDQLFKAGYVVAI